MKLREITYAEALREALREEMIRNPNVILFGEEIGIFGGAYKITRGLLEEFGPERVRDTPISEIAIAGAGIEEHLHYHIIPRWVGDTHFMAILSEVRVIPEHVTSTYDKLFPLFNRE